jgi:hypothetical protein
MLFQNLKAIGEELSEVCVLFCKYFYIFIYIDCLNQLTPSVYLEHTIHFHTAQLHVVKNISQQKMEAVSAVQDYVHSHQQ